jgi:hypothetical protein
MTKTVIYGTILAAVFVISMVVAVPLADAAGHIFIKKTEVEVKNLTKLEVEIKVTAKIPKDGSASAFGYGIITDSVGVNNVLALTTHKGVLDHPSQSGASDPKFHAHVLDLAPVTGAGSITNPCTPATSDVVVDFASSIASGNNIGAPYKVKVDDKEIEVKKVPTTDLNDPGVEAIVAFTITGVGTDPNAPAAGIPWLCLDIVGVGVGL